MGTTTDQTGAVRHGLLVSAAMMSFNVANYVFMLIAARLLGPGQFGIFAALSGLLLVINVLALGVQTTAARRLATAPSEPGPLARQLLVLTGRTSIVVLAVCLLLAPVVTFVLHLSSLTPALLLAACIGPQVMIAGLTGVLQGTRRWPALAITFFAFTIGRLSVGVATMWLMPDATGAMLGTALGTAMPLVIGLIAVRRVATRGPATVGVASGTVREVVHNSQALLAFLMLSNVDVVIARHTLDSHQAGLYAAGLILVKAVLFLPQFVLMLAFPGMASGGTVATRRRRHSLLLTLAAGVGVVIGVSLLPSVALEFVGGPSYREVLPLLPVFAIVGATLAVLQVVVYDLVARQRHAISLAFWAGFAVIACSTLVVDSPAQLLRWVLLTDLSLVGLVLVASFGAQRAVMRWIWPPDKWERLTMVAARVGAAASVYDVGGRGHEMQRLLPAATVYSVNVEPNCDIRVTPGTLPFTDGAADCVTSCDVLEHIPPADREDHLAELVRVANHRVVLCFPCGSDHKDAAEQALAATLHDDYGVRFDFLDEHLLHGLPRAGEVTKHLSRLPRVRSVTAAYRNDLEASDQVLLDAVRARYKYDIRALGRFARTWVQRPVPATSSAPTPTTSRAFITVELDPVRAESVGGGAPVGAEADRDVERDGEVGGAGHLLADQ